MEYHFEDTTKPTPLLHHTAAHTRQSLNTVHDLPPTTPPPHPVYTSPVETCCGTNFVGQSNWQ